MTCSSEKGINLSEESATSIVRVDTLNILLTKSLPGLCIRLRNIIDSKCFALLVKYVPYVVIITIFRMSVVGSSNSVDIVTIIIMLCVLCTR
jgi:hypothetical protein